MLGEADLLRWCFLLLEATAGILICVKSGLEDFLALLVIGFAAACPRGRRRLTAGHWWEIGFSSWTRLHRTDQLIHATATGICPAQQAASAVEYIKAPLTTPFLPREMEGEG